MKRFLEIDLIKVFALILMPMSHIYDDFGVYYDLMKNIPEYATKQLGLLFMNVPSIFMICLGLGIVFSKNSTPKQLMLRGFSMFLIEIVLNIFRLIIPHSIAGYFTSTPQLIKDSFEIFFMSDILPFAGFAFLIFALFKKLNLSNKLILLTGLFCTLIQAFIPQPEIGNVYLRYLTGCFIYVDDSSFFPVISWIIYPIIGYFLGQKLIAAENKIKFYLKVGGFGLFLLSITIFYLLYTKTIQVRYFLFMETGFHMDLFTTLIIASTSLITTSIGYFISRLIKNNFLQKTVSIISVNINSIYCIHWVLVKILWMFAFIFAYKIEYNWLFIIGFLIFITSSFIAFIRKQFQKV